MEKTVFLQFRCPSCQKLFKVGSANLPIGESHFECPACFTQFAFSYPGECKPWIVRQKRAERNSSSAPTLPCPKCGGRNPSRQEVCTHCEALIFRSCESFPKASENTEPSIRTMPSLKRKWRETLERYDQRNLHLEFVHLCDQLEALDFATTSYGEVLRIQPDDTLTQEMLALAKSHIQKTAISKMPNSEEVFFRFLRNHWPIWLGLLCIVLGAFKTPLRNLVGVGVGVIFLHFGLQYIHRRQRITGPNHQFPKIDTKRISQKVESLPPDVP